MIWTLNKPFLIVLLLILDAILLNQILQNKKSQVLGVKTKVHETVSRKAAPKANPPVLSISLAEERYPSKLASSSGKTNPTLTSSPSPTPRPTSNSNQSIGFSTSNQVSVKIKSSSNSLLDQINSFRTSKGMNSVSENTETCAFAQTRAGEIAASFNHDGFTNRVNSNTLPYPSYSTVAENIAMNSQSNQVVAGWIDSPGHAENLLKDVPYGCIRSSENYFVFEAWQP